MMSLATVRMMMVSVMLTGTRTIPMAIFLIIVKMLMMRIMLTVVTGAS
jgi:hypothetical protein